MPVPRAAVSPGELLAFLSGIDHAAALRAHGIHDVAWTATFGSDESTIDAARWIVWEASQQIGCPSASIHDLYMARGRGEVGGFTVPAINLRTQVFDMVAAAT